jgi:hypothetical protein
MKYVPDWRKCVFEGSKSRLQNIQGTERSSRWLEMEKEGPFPTLDHTETNPYLHPFLTSLHSKALPSISTKALPSISSPLTEGLIGVLRPSPGLQCLPFCRDCPPSSRSPPQGHQFMLLLSLLHLCPWLAWAAFALCLLRAGWHLVTLGAWLDQPGHPSWLVLPGCVYSYKLKNVFQKKKRWLENVEWRERVEKNEDTNEGRSSILDSLINWVKSWHNIKVKGKTLESFK